MLTLLKLILATWRLTAMFIYDEGPFHSFARLRQKAAEIDPDENHVGGVLSCVWCCSVWSAAVVLILNHLTPFLVNILALSAGAVWYDKHTS